MSALEWLLLFGVLVTVQAQDVNSYSDSVGRAWWKLQFYSCASNAEKCIPQYNPGWKVLNKITTQGTSMFGVAQVTLSVNIDQKLLNVAFRGPDLATTFVISGLQYLVVTPPLEDFQYGLKVANEYATTFNALWAAGLRQAINVAWDEYCDFTLLISGVSVGSCLGQMMTIKMNKDKMWDYDKIQYYGYSAPRCGDQTFALTMDASSYVRYRIQYQDYVTTLPWTNPCTTAVYPTMETAQNCYWHCCWALKYFKTGGFLGIGATTTTNPSRCSQSESTTCTTGYITDTLNHKGFFESWEFPYFGTLSC